MPTPARAHVCMHPQTPKLPSACTCTRADTCSEDTLHVCMHGFPGHTHEARHVRKFTSASVPCTSALSGPLAGLFMQCALQIVKTPLHPGRPGESINAPLTRGHGSPVCSLPPAPTPVCSDTLPPPSPAGLQTRRHTSSSLSSSDWPHDSRSSRASPNTLQMPSSWAGPGAGL
jgi:hypothetical protein